MKGLLSVFVGFKFLDLDWAKEKKQIRAIGGGFESTPEKKSTGSPESSPPSSGKVQYSLKKFFGSASSGGNKREEPEKPVSVEVIPYKRRRLSRFQLDAQRERDEAIQAKAEMEASLANDEKELIQALPDIWDIPL